MKTFLPLLFFLLLVSAIANAQPEKSPNYKFLTGRGYKFPDSSLVNGKPVSRKEKKWPDTLYYNTPYKAKLLGSPTIPFSFSNVELVHGEFTVNPSISIGLGYTWFIGNFTFNQDDIMKINPTFYFGAISDVGLQNSLNLNKLTGIFAGGFIGFGAFSLFFGYDFEAQSPSVGLNGRVDLFTISQNFLTPFGNVRELRKHKKSAIPIEDE